MANGYTEGLEPMEARDFRVERSAERDLVFKGWIVGVGEHSSDPKFGFTTRRGVIVSIYVSEAGAIITATKRWSDEPKEGDRYTADAHDSPTSALEWLASDAASTEGLGKASKEAWLTACESAAGLKSEAEERIA